MKDLKELFSLFALFLITGNVQGAICNDDNKIENKSVDNLILEKKSIKSNPLGSRIRAEDYFRICPEMEIGDNLFKNRLLVNNQQWGIELCTKMESTNDFDSISSAHGNHELQKYCNKIWSLINQVPLVEGLMFCFSTLFGQVAASDDTQTFSYSLLFISAITSLITCILGFLRLKTCESSGATYHIPCRDLHIKCRYIYATGTVSSFVAAVSSDFTNGSEWFVLLPRVYYILPKFFKNNSLSHVNSLLKNSVV